MRRSILVALALLFLLMAVGLATADTAALPPAPPAAAPTPAASTSSPAPAVYTPAQIMEEFGKAVVFIVSMDQKEKITYYGTGFLVTSDGRIVTNYHVINKAYPAAVKLASGDIYDDISVIDYDVRKDLAVIKIKGFGLPTVRFGNSDDAKIGDRLIVIGHPEGLENTISDGLLSGVRPTDEGYRQFQLSAPISHGSSGGPVFTTRGEVIGVVCSMLVEGQNLNFAIPTNYVRGMVDGKVKCELKNLPKEGAGALLLTGKSDLTPAEGMKALIDGVTDALQAVDLRNSGRNKCQFDQDTYYPALKAHTYKDAVVDSDMYRGLDAFERAKKKIAEVRGAGGVVGDLADTAMECVTRLAEAQNNTIRLFLATKTTTSVAALRGFDVDYHSAEGDLEKMAPRFASACHDLAPDLLASLPPGLRENPPLRAGQGLLKVYYPVGRDVLTVLNVVEGGPADRAGLREGDVILGVEDGPEFKGQKDFIEFIRAHPDQRIRLRVRRGNDEKTIRVTPEAYKP